MYKAPIITNHLEQEISSALSAIKHDKTFILLDENTKIKCWEKIKNFSSINTAYTITIKPGDKHKNLTSVSYVWQNLQKYKATRHSLLINLGGGMVTDLGGFAASTFKRGIKFINIPTTLLAIIDASIGGKTGINFEGYKNEIGVFNESQAVIIDTIWLKTLDKENILSGYAEMIKHSLLANELMWAKLIKLNIEKLDDNTFSSIVKSNIKVKAFYVKKDPHEKGIRKSLNFGHTFGHAFETWFLKKSNILHGTAIAYGIICELYLSVVKQGFPIEKMRATVNFIKENYGTPLFDCKNYDKLIEIMSHDKKNISDNINVTLLSDIGNIHINQFVNKNEIKEAFDFIREI